MSRTAIGAVVLLVIYGSTLAWGFHERSGRLRWKSEADASAIRLTICQSAAERQNREINAMRERMAKQKRLSQAELKKLERESERAKREHAALVELMKKPTTEKSCDSAWNDIEKNYR